MAKLRPVRWGHLHELDRRVRSGTSKFYEYPKRLQHLHAWRAMHKLAGDHKPVQMSGTRQRVRPSSDMSIKQKVNFVEKRRV